MSSFSYCAYVKSKVQTFQKILNFRWQAFCIPRNVYLNIFGVFDFPVIFSFTHFVLDWNLSITTNITATTTPYDVPTDDKHSTQSSVLNVWYLGSCRFLDGQVGRFTEKITSGCTRRNSNMPATRLTHFVI